MNHETFIKRCFELARLGMGRVSPNPMVGSVLVKNGRILSEGYHTQYGAPHAEAECLNHYHGTIDEEMILYVNLEPCCHANKKTPPCTPLIIDKNIKKVVISNLDPNPEVSGKGVELLRQKGIEVVTGILEKEGAQLNEIFFYSIKNNRPFIHIKSAMTLDGKIALSNGVSQWITTEASRLDSHWGRLQHDAILCGAETLRKDDPSLTVRIPGHDLKRHPWRIVLTVSGLLPEGAKLFTDDLVEKTIIVTGKNISVPLPEEQIIRLSQLGPFAFYEFYEALMKRQITSVWIEGGAGIQSLFIAAKQAQRLTLYVSPKIMGEGVPLFQGQLGPSLQELPCLTNVQMTFKGSDLKVTGNLDYSP